MKRKKLPPDKRLDWRDPNMPVLRLGFYSGKPYLFEVEPDKITKYYVDKLNNPNYDPPDYDHDPSYNWNRKVKK